MSRYHRLTKAERDKIIQLSKQGVLGIHLAARFDVKPSTIYEVKKKNAEKEAKDEQA